MPEEADRPSRTRPRAGRPRSARHLLESGARNPGRDRPVPEHLFPQRTGPHPASGPMRPGLRLGGAPRSSPVANDTAVPALSSHAGRNSVPVWKVRPAGRRVAVPGDSGPAGPVDPGRADFEAHALARLTTAEPSAGLDVDRLRREARRVGPGLPKAPACARGGDPAAPGRAPGPHPQTDLARRAPGPQIPEVAFTVTDHPHLGRRTGPGPFPARPDPSSPRRLSWSPSPFFSGSGSERKSASRWSNPRAPPPSVNGHPGMDRHGSDARAAPTMSTRRSVAFKPWESGNVVSWTARIRRGGRQRSTLASRCPSRMGSIVILGFDHRR